MTSPLEKLRAIARNTVPPYEKNEISPPKPPQEVLFSFNSFISSPDSPATRGVGGQDERSSPTPHGHDRAEWADTVETEPGQRSAALSRSPASPAEVTSSLEQRLVITLNPPRPRYEKNERNEISPPEPPPEGLISFNSFLSSPDGGEPPAKRTDPQMWLKAFAGMVAMPAPSGFSAQRWRRIIDATGNFLDGWADAAAACGWTELDIFGCNSDRPDGRFDAMGLALLLDRCEVIGVDETGADLVTTSGARQRFRRRSLPRGTVPLWRLVRR